MNGRCGVLVIGLLLTIPFIVVAGLVELERIEGTNTLSSRKRARCEMKRRWKSVARNLHSLTGCTNLGHSLLARYLKLTRSLAAWDEKVSHSAARYLVQRLRSWSGVGGGLSAEGRVGRIVPKGGGVFDKILRASGLV